MSEILAEATFPSVVHNNEVSEEIVKWGNKNGFPLKKAKLYNKMDGYVGFSPDNYFIKATRLPPVPGGWKVVVEKYDAEERYIPLNVTPDGTVNRFILKKTALCRLCTENAQTPIQGQGQLLFQNANHRQ